MKNTSLIQQSKGDISQMSIEHIAMAAILNTAYMQLTRFRITNGKQLNQTFKQEFTGLWLAMSRCLKFLKLEDKRWNNVNKLTQEEIETVQDNIILASAPITKFCRIAAQIPSSHYTVLQDLVNDFETKILEAIPEKHKEAFINAIKGI
jgi:membrane-associated HD superfamily phosphohydrolase